MKDYNLKVYLIFPDRNHIFNYFTIKCFRSELDMVLVDEGLLNEGENWRDCEWVIFEDGEMM